MCVYIYTHTLLNLNILKYLYIIGPLRGFAHYFIFDFCVLHNLLYYDQSKYLFQ